VVIDQEKESSDAALYQLIGLQRVGFARAAWRQRATIVIQILIAIVASATVFVPEQYGAYLAALFVMLLGIGYAASSWFYKEARFLAERIRRITLFSGGLGTVISISERQDILARFSQEELIEGEKLADPNYCASSSPVGSQRLAEMLEEAAFFTFHQFRLCAAISWTITGGLLLLSIFMLFSILPFVSVERALVGVRVVCAMIILLLSNDFFGNSQDYTAALVIIKNVIARIETNKEAGYPLDHLLLIVGDYNSAVERAPMVLPGVYRLVRDKLNRSRSQHPGSPSHDRDPAIRNDAPS
jgi:hypothetical protein